MLADIVDLLRCPHCRAALSLHGATVGCATGHRFDVARQGQLNLLRGAAGATADTAAMVADRVAFLADDHYAPIAELVADAAGGDIVVEAGAGTGYYLSGALGRLGPAARGVATDLSAYACRRAAKLPRVGAVVADTWAGLPIRDGVAETLLTVFAPRNFAEFARICAPAGRVLIVTPLPEHLIELRQAHGLLQIETDKQHRLLTDAQPFLKHEGSRSLRYEVALSAAAVGHLIGMGPNAFHTATAPTEAARTTVAVRLDVFTRLTLT